MLISRTIHQAGKWPLVVRVGEQYQLLVDKVVIGEGLCGLTVQVVLRRDNRTYSKSSLKTELKSRNGWQWLGRYLRQVVLSALAPVVHEIGQPFFPLIHFLFAKGLKKRGKNWIIYIPNINCILASNLWWIKLCVMWVYIMKMSKRCATSYKGDSFIVFRTSVLEWDTVSLDITEILLGFLRCAGSQTCVVKVHKVRLFLRWRIINTQNYNPDKSQV